MAMGCVLAHADVANAVQIRELLLRFPERLLHDAIFIVSAASASILVIGNTKKHDAAHARFHKLLQCVGKLVDTVTVLTRHGRNLLFDSGSFFYKHRVNQGTLVHPGLPHHFP